MALAFDGSAPAANTYVSCGSAAGLDNIAAGTVLVWARPTDVANEYRVLISKGWDQGTSAQLGWDLHTRSADGTQLRFTVGRATSIQGVNSTPVMSANTWGCAAATWDITNGGPKIYYGTLTATLADVSASPANGSGAQNDDSGRNVIVGAQDDGSLGYVATAYYGSIAVAMVWNRVLSLAELRAQQFYPHPTAGCVLFTHLGYNGTGTQVDLSGNGNNGTVSGATVADHVPLKRFWLGVNWAPYVVAGGGTTYTATLNGSTSSSGGVNRAVSKGLAGAMLSSGAILWQAEKTMAGSSPNSGALARQSGKLSEGATANSGTVGKQPTKSLGGATDSAGVVARQAAKALAGTTTNAGALATIKVALLSLTGNTSSVGALARAVGKVLSGTTANSGTMGNQTAKALAGTTSSAGDTSSQKVTLLSVAGITASAGSLFRQTAKALSGTTASGGSLAKQAAKTFTAATASVGALSAQKVVLLALSGATASVGTIIKRVGKALSGAITSIGDLARAITQVATASGRVTPTDAAVAFCSPTDAAAYTVMPTDVAVGLVSPSDSQG